MGNTASTQDAAPETPGLVGKLGAIPRAAAITEGGGGKRKGGAAPKLPPNSIKSQAEDWPYIEVGWSCHHLTATCCWHQHACSLPRGLMWACTGSLLHCGRLADTEATLTGQPSTAPSVRERQSQTPASGTILPASSCCSKICANRPNTLLACPCCDNALGSLSPCTARCSCTCYINACTSSWIWCSNASLGLLHLLQQCLNKLLLMGKLDAAVQRKVVQEMYERKVTAGEILIKEGDTGELICLLFQPLGVPLLSVGDAGSSLFHAPLCRTAISDCSSCQLWSTLPHP